LARGAEHRFRVGAPANQARKAHGFIQIRALTPLGGIGVSADLGVDGLAQAEALVAELMDQLGIKIIWGIDVSDGVKQTQWQERIDRSHVRRDGDGRSGKLVSLDTAFKPTTGTHASIRIFYESGRARVAMSDTSGDEMPCEEVLERVYEFLDGELTPEVDAKIREHLASCTRCYPQFRHEEVFLRFIERRAQIEKAPPSLRRRIFKQLLDDEIDRNDE
jgi:mycothiol system anti-sigma-R factor